MKSSKLTLLCWTAGALMLTSAQPLAAGSLLIDRGLPTANLNNSSGANRSNVAWAYGIDASGSWLVGDTFTNATTSTFFIDTIRLWTVGETTAPVLFGGLVGSDYSAVSSFATATPTQYAGGIDYQGSSGSSIQLNQLDFAVNITLGANETYAFFLDGSRSTSPFLPFLHASNAALSGSLQEGADDSMLFGVLSGGAIASGDTGTWSSLGDGWDKASDVNVQVFGTVPEASSTLGCLLLTLGGLVALRRKLQAN
jgi:hypothetical protein